MKAAGLIDIDTVVSSTAVLIKSKNPTNPALVDLIASRILGVISKLIVSFPNSALTKLLAAQKYVLCQYNVKRISLAAATKITPGKRAPTINALEEEGWVAVRYAVFPRFSMSSIERNNGKLPTIHTDNFIARWWKRRRSLRLWMSWRRWALRIYWCWLLRTRELVEMGVGDEEREKYMSVYCVAYE